MNTNTPPPPYWQSIVEFDRIVDRIAMLLEQRQERDLIRRAHQSDCAFLKLQAE